MIVLIIMRLRHYSVARWRHHVILPATLSLRRKQRISNCKTNDTKVLFLASLTFYNNTMSNYIIFLIRTY